MQRAMRACLRAHRRRMLDRLASGGRTRIRRAVVINKLLILLV